MALLTQPLPATRT